MMRNGEREKKKSVAERMIEMVEGGSILFHDHDKNGYASWVEDGIQKIYAIKSEGFKEFIASRFYKNTRTLPAENAIEGAIRHLNAKAKVDGPEMPVFCRIGPHRGNGVAIDLGSGNGLSVLVTPGSVEVGTAETPFVQNPGMRALPRPDRNGKLEELWSFLNVESEDQRLLLAAWLVAALYPSGPYVVLEITGAQGSAKSTTARVLRSLVDPSTVPLQPPPNSERDLMIAAKNTWVLCFDNLRKLPSSFSDMICRLSTGGGLRVRKLYTDDEEVLVNVVRPVILTSIKGVVSEGDLIDRSIRIDLPAIPETSRLTEADFRESFKESRQRIFGALVSILSDVLRVLPEIKLDSSPRMADFARIGVATEQALGMPEGSFLESYRNNRVDGIFSKLDDDPLARAILSLAREKEVWHGTASSLSKELRLANAPNKFGGELPRTPRALSVALRSKEPILRELGVGLEFDLNYGGEKRVIKIERKEGRDAINDGEDLQQEPAVPLDLVETGKKSVSESGSSAREFSLKDLTIDVPEFFKA